MDAKCHDSAQLNICDDQAVDALSAALKCLLPTDLYQAVAMVGDRICCIRLFIRKTVTRNIGGQHPRSNVYELPPGLGSRATAP